MPIKKLSLASGETYTGECSEHLYGDQPNGHGLYQKGPLKRIGVHRSLWTVVPKMKPRLCVYPVGNVIQWIDNTYQALQYDGTGKELSRKTTVFSEPTKENMAGKVDYLVYYPILNIQKILGLTLNYQQAPWDHTQVRVYHAHLGEADLTTYSANGPGLRFVSLKDGNYLERIEGEFLRGQFVKGDICKEFKFPRPPEPSSIECTEADTVEQTLISCRHIVSGDFIDYKLNGIGETSISCSDVAKVNADANPPIHIHSQFVSIKGVWNQGLYHGNMTFVLANGTKIHCQYQNNQPVGIITMESPHDGRSYTEVGDSDLEYICYVGGEQALGYKIRKEPVEAWQFLAGLIQKGYHELFRFCLQSDSFETLRLIHQKLLMEGHLKAANACFALTAGVINHHRLKFEALGCLISDVELIQLFTDIQQDVNVLKYPLYQCVPFIIELLNPQLFSFETCRQLSLFIPNIKSPCPTGLKENQKKSALREFKKQFETHSLPWVIERFRLIYEPQYHLYPQLNAIGSFFQMMDMKFKQQIPAMLSEEITNRALLERIAIEALCVVHNESVRDLVRIRQFSQKRMQTFTLEQDNIQCEEGREREKLITRSAVVFEGIKTQFNHGYANIKARHQRLLTIMQEMVQLQNTEHAQRQHIKIEQEEQRARQQLKAHAFTFFKTQKKELNRGYEDILSWRKRCIAFSRPSVSELLFDIPIFLKFSLLEVGFYARYHFVEKIDERVLHAYQYLILRALKCQNSLLGEAIDAHEHELMQAEAIIFESKADALMKDSAENYVQGLLFYLDGNVINKENILCHVPLEYASNMKMTDYFYRLVIRELVRRGAPFNTDSPRPDARCNEIYLALGEALMMEWDATTKSYSCDSSEWLHLELAAKQYVQEHVRVIPNTRCDYLVEEKNQRLGLK